MAIPEISVSELASRLETGASLVDVRNPDEFEAGHVPGAVLIPLPEIPDRVGEIPTDRTVLFICRSGARSGQAVDFLRGRGIDAVNVAGGTLAWIDEGKPLETGGAG